MNKKEQAELEFQREWAEEFSDTSRRGSVHTYWILMRHLSRVSTYLDNLGHTPRILDVGCGISTVLHWLKGELHGVDPLAEAYKKIYRYPSKMSIIKGSAEALSYGDARFDLVVCSNALDHVDDPPAALAEMVRVAKPGAMVLLTCEVYHKVIKRDAAHPWCFTEDGLISKCIDAGFKIDGKETSPWIGLRRFATEGRYNRSHGTDEVILFMKTRE